MARRTGTGLRGSSALARVVGRWDLTSQAVNIVMGAAIFVLPGVTLPLMGGWAPLAVLITTFGVLLMVLSFAEAAGRYQESGGPYRYVGDAFGEYVGAQVGLLYWVVRATASAAIANVFVTYLVEFWPSAADPFWRALVLTILILGCGWVNIRGTRRAASVVNLFTIGKLLPLGVLIVAGAFLFDPRELKGTPLPESSAWARAILLWVFAFGGWEAILIPAGEARDPVRDAPRGLLQALVIIAVVYAAVQALVAGTLRGEIPSRPVGETARVLLGDPGAFLIAAAAVIAPVGHILVSILASSRLTFALAERRQLPAILARVHPRYRTPDVSIAAFTLLTWLLAVSGSFTWNASISAVGRLIVYAATSLAVLRLRRAGRSHFQVPAWIHLVAAVFCAWLFAHQTLPEAVAVSVVWLAGSAAWVGYRLWSRRHPAEARPLEPV